MRAPPTHGSWSATTLRACPRRTSAGLAGSGSFHPHHTILKSFGPKISHPPPVGRTVLPSARNNRGNLPISCLWMRGALVGPPQRPAYPSQDTLRVNRVLDPHDGSV